MNSMLVAISYFEWRRQWRITAASLVDTTDLPWNLLPLLPPYLYAHLAMKPLRNPFSRDNQTHSFPHSA
jgi:hypothetical protein